MAKLTVQPLRVDEVDDFIRIYWTAFELPEADMIFPMIYPKGLQPELFANFRNRIVLETDGNIGDVCFAAKDTETGEIVAVSRWAVTQHPARTQAEIDAEYEQARQLRYGGPPITGMNKALGEAFLKVVVYTEWELMQGRPYVSLRVLATHPDHQRRGAGWLLLKDGLARFSGLRLPTYLDAGITRASPGTAVREAWLRGSSRLPVRRQRVRWEIRRQALVHAKTSTLVTYDRAHNSK